MSRKFGAPRLLTSYRVVVTGVAGGRAGELFVRLLRQEPLMLSSLYFESFLQDDSFLPTTLKT